MAIDWNKIKSNAQTKDAAQYSAMKADKEKVVSAGGDFSTLSPAANYNKKKSDLEKQRRQAQVDLDVNTVNRIDAELKALRAKAGQQTAADRIGDTVGASASNTVGSIANAAGTVVNLFQDPDKNRRDIARLQEALKTGYTSDRKPITDSQRKAIEDSIEKLQAQISAWEAPDSTVNKLYSLADTAAKDTERFTQDAKTGLGKGGQFAVDLGIGAGQLATDIAASALIPGAGTALMATRVFGGTTQEARQEGANLGEQVAGGLGKSAVAVLTGKLANISGPFKGAYGKGFLDNALSKVAAKPAGKLVMSMLSEGTEEFFEAVADPIIEKMTYNKDAKYDADWFADALYSAAIGGVLGGVGGVTDIATSAKLRNSAEGSVAPIPVASDGSNAPEANIAQNASKSQINGKANYDPMEAAAIQKEAKTFRNLVAGVDEKVSSFFEKWRNGRVSQNGEKLEKLYLGKMPESVRKEVSAILGYDVNKRDFIITNDTVKHVYDHHGNAKAETDRGNIPLEPWMFDALPDVVTNPDSIKPGDVGKGNKNAGKQAVLFSKAYPGGTIITVQFDNKGRGTMEINTLYANKNKGTTSKLDVTNATPNSTSETLEPVPSDNSVAQENNAVNTNDGLGAANVGFDPYSNLQNQTDKFHPEGPNAARPTDMPTTNAEGRNIPKSASTIYGAKGTTESGVKVLEQKIVNGEIAFDTITDANSVANAKNTIAEKTFEGALEQYRQAVNSGVASKDNTTLGQQLLLQAMRDGNETATAELLTLYTRNSTTTAQALQAQSIFRKLSPEGQLVAVQKAIDAMNKKYGVEHTIDPADVKAFLEAKDEAARKEAEKNIVQKAAQSVPGTFKAKFDTIRYLAMLGNARTHIRNILGNTLFQVPVSVKNRVGAIAEIANNAFSENKVERTKSLLGANPFGALAKDAKADWANVKDFLSQNTKYNENRSTLKDIENAAHAFSDDTLLGKTINTLSDKNSDLLAAEDMMAKRMIYTQSLAGYLKANGCKSIADASSDLLNRARTYAANEALKNTFNDKNAFSDAVAKIGNLKESNNAVVRGAGYVAEGVLPFKRTPANILVRAEEYSPIGAGVGIINTIRGAKSGDAATISKGLDQLASGLTGVALMKLGAMAVANGWVTGGEDKDEKQEDFDELTGHQNYSLELKDGTSVTLDWLAPEAIPFFVGVELYNSGLNGKMTISEVFDALGNATAPMLELSMLQSLNDTVNNASYAAFNGGSVLKSLVTSALTNYVTQAVPTLGGQIERSGEEQRMTTHTDKNSNLSTDMQYTIGKVSQKIPGWDYQQIPYIDAWGRTESNGDPLERAANNLFNPAYMSEVDVDKVEQELQRVYNADKGESGNVFPQKADKSFTVNKETRNLTADEYVKYAKAKGQNSYKLAQEAINSAAYKSMSDSGKAAFIDDMYGYADYKAKKAVAPKYSNEKYAKYEAAEKAGMSPSAYYVMKETYDYDHSSSTGQPTQEEAQRYLDTETNLSQNQKADLWTIINNSWKNNPYK